MLYFDPNYFKANEICEKAIKKLCFTVIHVPNQQNSFHICERVIIESSGMLQIIPNQQRTQEFCEKAAVDYYPFAFEFVSYCCKTQEIRNKAVNTYDYYFQK